jgi:hypothetical protein
LLGDRLPPPDVLNPVQDAGVLEVIDHWTAFEAGVPQFQQFLTVLVLSALIFPGCVLPWADLSP